MPRITFHHSGNHLFLNEGSSLIELEDTGKSEVPFGCRAASCATCLIQVISGGENLNPKTEDEVELLEDFNLNQDDRRLACQCKIYGDIEIQAIDK